MRGTVCARTWRGFEAFAEDFSLDIASLSSRDLFHRTRAIFVFDVGPWPREELEVFIQDVYAYDGPLASTAHQMVAGCRFEERRRLLPWPRILLWGGRQRPESVLFRCHVGLSPFTLAITLFFKRLELFVFLLSWSWIFILFLNKTKTCGSKSFIFLYWM